MRGKSGSSPEWETNQWHKERRVANLRFVMIEDGGRARTRRKDHDSLMCRQTMQAVEYRLSDDSSNFGCKIERDSKPDTLERGYRLRFCLQQFASQTLKVMPGLVSQLNAVRVRVGAPKQ